MKTVLKTLPLAVLLAACSFVPAYEQPEVDLASAWMDVSLSEQSGEQVSNIGWREFFQDGQLQTLIEAALAHNHDLRKAALNVQLAAEQYGVAEANRLPTLGLNAGANRSRTGSGASATGREIYADSFRAGLGIASFELDFFGRVSALSEAALNQYLQTQEARDAAQLSVIKAVAQAYYSARISKALMDLSEQVLAAREETAKLAKLQFDVGLISGVTLHSYENAIESAKADYYGYERNYQQALNALSVLVAMPLEKLQLPAANDLAAQFAAMPMPAGLPSQILQQRPDVRQAEFALKAANANIGAARAALFPIISLTGSAGYASAELNQLLQGPNSVWSIGPSISLPIFNRAQLNANVRVSEISQQMAVENYQSAVKTAFQEVADALVARESYAKQFAAAQRAADAQAEVLRLERMRFEAGVSDGLTLIDAERINFTAQQGLLAVQLNLLQNMVKLYAAMGGGLQEYGLQIPATAGEAEVNVAVEPVSAPVANEQLNVAMPEAAQTAAQTQENAAQSTSLFQASTHSSASPSAAEAAVPKGAVRIQLR